MEIIHNDNGYTEYVKITTSTYIISERTRTITILGKINALHVANALNLRFVDFSSTEKWKLINTDETFSMNINVHPKYVQKYLDNILNYILNI